MLLIKNKYYAFLRCVRASACNSRKMYDEKYKIKKYVGRVPRVMSCGKKKLDRRIGGREREIHCYIISDEDFLRAFKYLISHLISSKCTGPRHVIFLPARYCPCVGNRTRFFHDEKTTKNILFARELRKILFTFTRHLQQIVRT